MLFLPTIWGWCRPEQSSTVPCGLTLSQQSLALGKEGPKGGKERLWSAICLGLPAKTVCGPHKFLHFSCTQAVPPAPSFTSDNFPAMHAAPAQATTPPVEPAPALMQRPVPRSEDPHSNAASSIPVSRQDQDGGRGIQAKQTAGNAILANLNAAALKLGKADKPPAAKAAAAAAAKAQLVTVPQDEPETRVNMKAVMRGAKLLGMTPSKAMSMRVDAPEFVPPPMPMSQASSGDLSRKSSGVFPKPEGSLEGSSTPGSGVQEAGQTQLSSAGRPYQPSAAPALPPPTSPHAGADGGEPRFPLLTALIVDVQSAMTARVLSA